VEREQYAVMARREEHHWWYAGMRRVALSVLDHALAGQSGLLILDAGCGTGGTTVRLRRYGRVVGLDLVWEALRPAADRGLDGHLVRGSVERLPFPAAAFDVATSFEVVYHLGVASDELALAELRRVLKPSGLLLLRVPAHDWLRGAHDRLVHTRHRYSRAEVAAKLARAGFAVEQLSWANSLLFPAAAAKRLLEPPAEGARAAIDANAATQAAEPTTPAAVHSSSGGGTGAQRPGDDHAAEPDLWQPPEPLNALLESLVAVEALALPRGIGLPFGLSVLALARAT
jgi:SAM-dependent methyltransferase